MCKGLGSRAQTGCCEVWPGAGHKWARVADNKVVRAREKRASMPTGFGCGCSTGSPLKLGEYAYCLISPHLQSQRICLQIHELYFPPCERFDSRDGRVIRYPNGLSSSSLAQLKVENAQAKTHFPRYSV